MFTKRNRIAIISLILVAGYFSSFAQIQNLDTTSLKKGAWAIQFGIASNFTLTSMQGTTFSAKYHFSEKNAIRGGISISGNTNNGTTSTTAIVNDTSNGTIPGTNSSSSQGFSFIIQYLWYMNPNGPIHFFAGVGPIVTYSYSQNRTDNSSIYSQRNWIRSINSSSSTQWASGGTISAGLEWFPLRWFSMKAEYGENIQYQWRSTFSSSDYSSTYSGYVPSHIETSGTIKGWVWSSSSVGFGMTVYW
jgi:hypothetical protein